MGRHAMTVKRINSLLKATAVACCALAGLVVAAAVLTPLDLGEREPGGKNLVASQPGAGRRPTTLPAGETGEAYLAHAWRGTARENLAANSQAAPSAGAPGAPPGPMTLVGTIGDALALIKLPDGSVVAKGVGEEVGDGSVVNIGSKGVEVLINGQHVLLSKPQPATSTGVLLEKSS
jgi:hypothetical protein